MATLYLAFTSGALSSYTPTRISTTQSSYSYELTYMTRMNGSITRGSTTYSQVFEISDTAIPSEYVADNTMDVWDYWLDDEDSTVNRAGPGDYGDVTTTVHVWECDAVENSSQRIGAVTNMISGTYIYYFDSYTTYSPVTPTWIKNGNTYNISVPESSSNNNLWVFTTHSLTAGKTYSISVTAKSEQNYDGVIVTSGSHSSAGSSWSTMTGWSDYVCGATGSNVTNTATFTATSSNKTLYIYFRTDGSTISPSPETGSVTITESSEPTTYAWTKSGNTYSITVADNNQWVLALVPVTARHSYTISMSVRSEANYDGIGLFSGSHSSGNRVDNMAGWSDCILTATSSSNGTLTTASTTWTASSGGNIYLYFYTDGSSIYPTTGSTGSVTFTDNGIAPSGVTVTLNQNSGSGGTTSVTITNGTTASNYPDITLPSRSGYTFLGYYDAITGGNCYYTSGGNGARTFDKTSDCTFYAHWSPIISEYYYSSATVYCTDAAAAYSTTQGTRTVKIADTAPSTTAGTLSVTVDSPSGWTLSSDKKYVNVPSGVSSGNYTLGLTLYVPASTPSHEAASVSVTVIVYVEATSISSYGNVTLSKTTLSQYADFPASAFTVSTSTIDDYFQYTGTVSQTITYNNGASRDGSISESWSGTSKSFSSLGTTESSRATVSFNTMSLVFTGEGNKTASATTNIGYRAANSLGTQHYKNTSGTLGDNTTYGTPTVSIGSGIWAYGGSATVTCSVSNSSTYYLRYTSGSYSSLQSETYTGTARWRITSNGNSAFTASGTSSTLSGIGTVYNTGGTITHEDMDTDERTDTVVVTAYNVNSTSKTSTAEDVTVNELGTQHYKNTSGTTGDNITYGTPTVSIGSGIGANGGSAIVTCSVSNTTTYYLRYTSLSYTSLQTSTSAGVAVWRITSNGNNRFSHPQTGGSSLSGVGTVYSSGDAVKHTNMSTNVATDTVIVTAYNMNSTSKTATATVSVSNSITTLSLSVASTTISYNGSTTFVTTANYTSGAKRDVTVDAIYTDNPTGVVSINKSDDDF